MTSTSANQHMPRILACVLSMALALACVAASAQSVVHPTQAQRAQHRAHVQQLKSQQQSRKLRQRLQKQINDTASKAYKHHPKVQQQMHHAADVRERQARTRDKDLEKKIRHADRPLPVHTAPAPADSR
ncbi:MAG TPA: hypothetical protein VFK31_09115 [Rhodanobacteraceae bacterium]|nr:hypothetical protein [Rhodanobacteraceae bacterium]